MKFQGGFAGNADARATWVGIKTPGEHIAARYANFKVRTEAASALLAMGLSVAARWVLDPDATVWPSLRQAREWQSSRREQHAIVDGAA